jgi:uncharacterized membrane protein (DUF2068 family)
MPERRDQSSYAPLVAIAIFKLLKGALLIAVGFGLHHLVHGDAEQILRHSARAVRVDPDNRFIHLAISKITGLSERQLRQLSIGTFLYAAVFLTEGIGLLLRLRWAEYLTVISTAALLPLEVYEMIEHPRPIKAVVLVLNILIVIYLVRRLYRTRKAATRLNVPGGTRLDEK